MTAAASRAALKEWSLSNVAKHLNTAKNVSAAVDKSRATRKKLKNKNKNKNKALQSALKQLWERGYTVFPSLLPSHMIEALLEEAQDRVDCNEIFGKVHEKTFDTHRLQEQFPSSQTSIYRAVQECLRSSIIEPANMGHPEEPC